MYSAILYFMYIFFWFFQFNIYKRLATKWTTWSPSNRHIPCTILHAIVNTTFIILQQYLLPGTIMLTSKDSNPRLLSITTILTQNWLESLINICITCDCTAKNCHINGSGAVDKAWHANMPHPLRWKLFLTCQHVIPTWMIKKRLIWYKTVWAEYLQHVSEKACQVKHMRQCTCLLEGKNYYWIMKLWEWIFLIAHTSMKAMGCPFCLLYKPFLHRKQVYLN
jgi:hypothetical protein